MNTKSFNTMKINKIYAWGGPLDGEKLAYQNDSSFHVAIPPATDYTSVEVKDSSYLELTGPGVQVYRLEKFSATVEFTDSINVVCVRAWIFEDKDYYQHIDKILEGLDFMIRLCELRIYDRIM